MKLRVLRYFLTVAREETMNRAADVLHITQPTLGRQLSQLEDELGVALFERQGRRVVLTADGLLLRRRAEEILELVDKAEQELTHSEDTVMGTVALGYGEISAMHRLAAFMRPDDPLAGSQELHSILAWKRGQPFSPAAELFIRHIQCLSGKDQ